MSLSRRSFLALLLLAFLVVGIFSFTHFYGMAYGAMSDNGSAESHNSCSAHMQLSDIILDTHAASLSSLILVVALTASLVISKISHKNSAQIHWLDWQFLYIKPTLFLNTMLRRGIIQPKLYA